MTAALPALIGVGVGAVALLLHRSAAALGNWLGRRR